MNLAKKILRSGLLEDDLYSRKRGILLSNYVSLILVVSALLIFIIRTIFFSSNTYALTLDLLIEATLIFTFPIILNRYSFTILGRLFLCFGSVIFLWHAFISKMVEMEVIESSIYDSIRMYILAISPIPFLIFDKNKNPYLILAMLPTCASILFFEYILSLANVNHAARGIPGTDYELMKMRSSIAYFIVCGTCYAFHVIITRNDEFNQKILMRLRIKSEEVMEQNKQLVDSQNRLNELNENLEILVEEKTESIKLQNAQLKKYAFANAHQVSGPVARLLGLIQLAKIEEDLKYPWIFGKIKDETESLDKIVKGITHELDNMNLVE